MTKTFHPMKSGTYRVSSGYGQRWGTMHAGIDFAAPIGTPLYAVADGVVVQGNDRQKGSVAGFGSWIWIDCQASCGKDFIYGHVDHEGILVKAGDRVRAGQQIGVVGNEGQSTGPHLHFEVWGSPGRLGGSHQDPAVWLQGKPSPGGNAQPAEKETPLAGTIFGIDISEHQRNFPLSKAKAEGMEFVILRLCDGTHVDSLFKSHLADAEHNGLLVATYWYLRAPSEGTTISQQVDVIDRQMGGRRDLGVWIDVESVSRSGAKLLSGGDVWSAKRELERRGYHVPGIYSGAWYWEHMRGGEPSMSGLGHLWCSNYGRNATGQPRNIYEADGGANHRGWSYPLGDRKPDLLQFGSNGLVAGQAVDVNAFKGARSELAKIFHPKTKAPSGASPKKGLALGMDTRIQSQIDPGKRPKVSEFIAWNDARNFRIEAKLDFLIAKMGFDPHQVAAEAVAREIGR
ncbi:peptidoglycan DD-metalloendopeptidase family protein [Corynebacterium ulceribovis]|uniref:peptidoglycan DD-metalloendopeptidase family protein n=1 Tax=Corynebacterium ulceribovis TaxID=487732 RepID=UPI0003737C30|nr:peptidoglycan DD-metalloendopeptidase family protein [Corynebacterium ulceribovis]